MAKGKKQKSKWLYSFEILRETTEIVKEKSTDDQGIEVTTSKSQPVVKDVEFKLQMPKRKQFEEAQLYYGVKLAEGIRAGLLTNTIISKKYQNEGGVFSENEQDSYGAIQLQMFQVEKEIQRIETGLADEEYKTDEEKSKKLSELVLTAVELRNNMQQFEAKKASIFEQTADYRAKNKTITWWVLNLSHYNNPTTGEIEPFFKGRDIEEKLMEYDRLEDLDEPYINEAIQKLAFYVAFWYSGEANTKEDFDRVGTFLQVSDDAKEVSEVMKKAREERRLKKQEEYEKNNPAPKEEAKEEPEEEPKEEPEEEPKEELKEEPKEEPEE